MDTSHMRPATEQATTHDCRRHGGGARSQRPQSNRQACQPATTGFSPQARSGLGPAARRVARGLHASRGCKRGEGLRGKQRMLECLSRRPACAVTCAGGGSAPRAGVAGQLEIGGNGGRRAGAERWSGSRPCHYAGGPGLGRAQGRRAFFYNSVDNPNVTMSHHLIVSTFGNLPGHPLADPKR